MATRHSSLLQRGRDVVVGAREHRGVVADDQEGLRAAQDGVGVEAVVAGQDADVADAVDVGLDGQDVEGFGRFVAAAEDRQVGDDAGGLRGQRRRCRVGRVDDGQG